MANKRRNTHGRMTMGSNTQTPTRYDTLNDVIVCAGVLDRATQSYNSGCITSSEKLAKDGELPFYPATVLALRGFPQYAPDGSDQAREMIARLVNADRNAGSATFAVQTHRDGQLPRSQTVMRAGKPVEVLFPATSKEVADASSDVVTGERVTYSPEKERIGMAQNSAAAVTNGFTDSLMNPDRVLQGKTAAELAAAWRSDPERNRGAVMSMVGKCYTPDVVTDPNTGKRVFASKGLAECSVAGARWGIYFQADHPEVRYDGSQFLGTKPAQTVRR